MGGEPVALGEIFEIARGGSPRPIGRFITDDSDGVNWVLIGDASSESKYITRTKKKIKPNGVSRSRRVKAGDFLLTNSMSFGRPYIMATDGCVHDGWLVLSPRAKTIDPNYFYHLLGSPTVYAEFCRLAAGATVKNLNIDLVKSVEVPLPPLDEQRRIAAILDQADALRQKRRTTVSKLDHLMESCFVATVGDLQLNPKGFPIGTLEELTTGSGLRCGPFGTQLKVSEIVAEGVPLLGIENVHHDKFLPTSAKNLTRRKAAELKAFEVVPDDVLVTRMGTIGRACVVPQSFKVGRISYHLFRIRPDKKKCLPEFLAASISRGGTFQSQLNRLAHGAIMSGLSTSDMRAVRFLVPPMNVQEDYVRQVRAIELMRNKAESQFQWLNDLFASLQRALLADACSAGARRAPAAAE